jgi:hypothetical protein
MCFDEFEKFSRARLSVGELGPARMRLPKRADAFFELGVCFGHSREQEE